MNFFSKLRRFLLGRAVGILSSLLVLLGTIFVAVMFCETVERWIGQLLGLCKKNEILTFVGLGMGGFVFVLQAVIANIRAKAMERQAKSQARATREQAKANEHTERGQRQERLKNAIEHLGHGAVSVRLGGAYELFHLAEDTPALSKTILDILCGHIRWTTGREVYQRENPSKPSEEVQSLLTMLFVQPHEVFKGLRADLQGSWLNGANLQDAHLAKADLNGAHLRGAILWQVDLRGTNLVEAFLSEAGLGEARLHGALLPGAWLHGATLRGAHLQGAILNRAHLQGVMLDNTQLRGVRSSEETNLLEFSKQTFEERIRASVDQASDLSSVIFSGGLTRANVDSIVEGFSDEEADLLRERLRPHLDQPPSNELPQGSGAVTRAYTVEEAERWIAEYRNEVEG